MRLGLGEKVAFLKITSFFSSFPEEKLKQVARLIEEVCFPKNSFLFHEGDVADFFYIIVSGEVSLIKDGFPLMTFHKRGEVLGEMSLIDEAPRSASLMAVTDLRVLRMSREHFDRTLIESPLFCRELFKLLSFRLREDTKERKRVEEAIRHQAYHDFLTGLPNRLLFKDRIDLALANARRNDQLLAVMFIDLDAFKSINDALGHKMGDQFLKNVADRLTGLLRKGDTIARFGGDEFTILLPGIKRKEDAAKIAQKVLDSIRQPWRFGEHEFHIGASVGIAIYPNDGQDAEALPRNADIAMYRAKGEGGNKYQFYDPAMSDEILNRLRLEASLRQALDRAEFTLSYQPRINLKSGKIVSLEALIRWKHPKQGMVNPEEFIPLAENSGLIVPIGTWALKAACKQNKAWQKSDFSPIRVSVNVSTYQFEQGDFVSTIDRILKESGLKGRWLELEITEGTAMKDVDHAISVLCELRKRGIHISIDDFGTGYSSLNYLKVLPINILKIDQSFVRDIHIDPYDAAIVETIIVLGKNLDLNVVAEGVETEEQLSFLKSKGCDDMQGYLYSKPLPAAELEKMLRGDISRSSRKQTRRS